LWSIRITCLLHLAFSWQRLIPFAPLFPPEDTLHRLLIIPLDNSNQSL